MAIYNEMKGIVPEETKDENEVKAESQDNVGNTGETTDDTVSV